MVDRSQASKPTLTLPGKAPAGWGTPSVNTPTPVPARKPGSRPRPLRQHLWRQQGRKRPSSAGFTLVELLIVVVIIGVLSGVAMPAFLGQRNRAKINAANMQARGLMSYCLAYFIDNGKMPDDDDDEYKRLAKGRHPKVIEWKAEKTNNKCKVNIKSSNFDLSRDGIFSIQASGDATRIEATPAKI